MVTKISARDRPSKIARCLPQRSSSPDSNYRLALEPALNTQLELAPTIPSPTRLLRMSGLATTAATAGPSSSTAALKITSHNQYSTPRLLPSSLSPSPLEQFHKWMAAAIDPVKAGEAEGTPVVQEPEAMVLSTATKEGRVSSRVVLLKGECCGTVYLGV
jgi:hypothetical protein